MCDHVSLVIPGRNCALTVGPCLEAVLTIARADDSLIAEILFVDDGSTDDTRSIVASFPVTILDGRGRGPGAARNTGWRMATSPLIWFVDSDCVAEPNALKLLLGKLVSDSLAGVGGSYGNMNPDSLLARLIHEEIVERHLTMTGQVNFLATFNVLYRRDVLQEVGGFDERLLKGQDAELSWRVVDAGHHLGFEIQSRVKHFHATSWGRYLWTQGRQGFWRVWMYAAYPLRAAGDSYSGFLDHAQPVLGFLCVASLPLVAIAGGWIVPASLGLTLFAAQLPMAVRLVRRTGDRSAVAFVLMGGMRAVSRGFGAVCGLASFAWKRLIVMVRSAADDRQ